MDTSGWVTFIREIASHKDRICRFEHKSKRITLARRWEFGLMGISVT